MAGAESSMSQVPGRHCNARGDSSMTSRRILAMLFAATAFALPALPGPFGAGQTGEPKQQPDASKENTPKKMSLDKLKMPPGGMVVLVEETKDPRSFFPRMVILTPEKYQDMADRLAFLEKLAKADRKTPHACKVKAVVEGGWARVTAELALQADQPGANIAIGLKGTQLSDAKVRLRGEDDPWRPALVEAVTEGYVVHLDKAGEYQMLVEAQVALSGGSRPTAPGIEHVLELSMPGSAVTTLALELPSAVRELRWNKTNVEKPQGSATEARLWQIALGKITQLQLAWTEPPAGGGATPLRTARGQVVVRFEDNQVSTTADLTLIDLNGKAKDWRLWLPAGAKVKVLSPDEPAHKLVAAGPYLHILSLNAASADPIKIQVTTSTSRNAAKVAVGPFAIQDAVRQEGTIDVKLPLEARRNVRLTYHVAGSLEERDPPRDQAGSEVVAVFKYWDMPVPPKIGPAAKLAVAPLEIEQRTVQGRIETHVEHQLRLVSGEQGMQVKAICTITAKPLDAPVDFLDIQLPRAASETWPLMPVPQAQGFPGLVPWGSWNMAGQHAQDSDWLPVSGPALIELIFPDAQARLQRKARLKWAQAQAKEFTISLEGTSSLPAGTRRTRLELPRPIVNQDRGAKGKVEVGNELELLVQDGGPEVPSPEKHRLTRSWERAPSSWEFGWRDYRAEFPVVQVTDLTFRPAHVHARQQWTWEAADRPRGPDGKPAPIRLDVPAAIKAFKVIGDGKIVALDRDKNVAWVDLPDSQGNGSLVVEYDFATPRPRENDPTPLTLNVPLAWLAQATHVDAKARLWSVPGLLPVLAPGAGEELAWKEIGTEAVAGKDNLPVRVLWNDVKRAPLVLRLERSAASTGAIVVDRALIQVSVDEDGQEQYRARLLLAGTPAPYIDVRMPLSLAIIGARFAINDKTVTWQPQGTSGMVARIELDFGQNGKPLLLEIRYQLPRDQPTAEGFLHTTLNPPSIDGDVVVGKVRWLVTFSPNVLALAARGDARNEQTWHLRDWLPTLEPAARPSELEFWLTGKELAEPAGDSSLLCARGSLTPVRVLRAPRAAWFLICSAAVLALGLVLYCLAKSALAWWYAMAGSLLALGTIGLLWPELVACLLLGIAPGVVLLASLLLVQWFVHDRYRRQLVFMPGFTRLKPGSSLIRPGGMQRRSEPSTIDAPAMSNPSNPAP
jgi:hypothetical protein